MKEIKKKTLFIVGSGPGDPELPTIKAYKAIENAEVILYDNLINQEILQIADKNCLKHYVGKHPYGKYVPQEEINELILHYCSKFDRVLRLKVVIPIFLAGVLKNGLPCKTDPLTSPIFRVSAACKAQAFIIFH